MVAKTGSLEETDDSGDSGIRAATFDKFRVRAFFLSGNF
jgi:hypothetical protein